MSPQSSISRYRIAFKNRRKWYRPCLRGFRRQNQSRRHHQNPPDYFESSADRLARSTREAQVLASLEYIVIAAICRAEGRPLVMELVYGPARIDRLIKGKLF